MLYANSNPESILWQTRNPNPNARAQMTGAAETMLYGLSVSLFLCLLHAVFHAESTDVEYTGLPTTSGDLELGSVDMSPLGDQAEKGYPDPNPG